MDIFDPKEVVKLKIPNIGETGAVTIIGGSELFHGAPILSLKVASRINKMVFFSSPEPSVGRVAEYLKSKLMSFIWVPWDEVERYIEKSDSILIGPGLMRYRKKNQRAKTKDRNWCDDACRATRDITHKLLSKYKSKKWVIDAGSLQVMDPNIIPKKAILTPNKKELEILFGIKSKENISEKLQVYASKYDCLILLKGKEDIIISKDKQIMIKGGNRGMVKGGMGDVLAGLVVSFYAENDAYLSASWASYIAKKAGDELFKQVGVNFNADDLADKIPKIIKESQTTK